MTQEELINVFKYIVKKCDMLINGDNYEADDYTQNNVEDIAELCNHILDGDYGKLAEESTMTKEEKDLYPRTQEEYEIIKIIIPETDIIYEIGYNNVCEIYESFKQVSNDYLKSIYVVKFKEENQLGFVEISADIKGVIVYKISKI
jgi:hypothetical protein